MINVVSTIRSATRLISVTGHSRTLRMCNTRIFSFASAAIFASMLTPTAGAVHVNIAVAGPMTGSAAALGAQMRDGTVTAAEASNASGLLPSTGILRVADDTCDPKQVVAASDQLTMEDVKLVVGPFCSASLSPASDVYADAALAQISPASSSRQLTERGLKTGFRICGCDERQGAVAAEDILRHYPDAKIAVLDDKRTAGKRIADVVASRLQEAGTKYVMRQSYVAGGTDYVASVLRMKSEGVQIAHIAGYYAGIGLIVGQAAEASADFMVTGNDPRMRNEFWSIASEAANGTLSTFVPDPTRNAKASDAVAKLTLPRSRQDATRSILMPLSRHGQTRSSGQAHSTACQSRLRFVARQSKPSSARFDST